MYAGFARNILNEFQQQETANQQRKGWRGRGLTLPFPAVFPLKLSSQASFSSVEKGHEHPYFFPLLVENQLVWLQREKIQREKTAFSLPKD